VTLSSLFPKPVDENNWGAFNGEFRTNFLLPNYLGIGNGITRGYGTMLGLFNPEMFSFNEGDLQELEAQAVKDEPEESIVAESDLQEIDVDRVPRPKKVPGEAPPKQPAAKDRPRRRKKVLSEEFDIEEDDALYETNVSKKKPASKKPKKRGKGKKVSKQSSDDEVNFNSAEYHKKQHSI